MPMPENGKKKEVSGFLLFVFTVEIASRQVEVNPRRADQVIAVYDGEGNIQGHISTGKRTFFRYDRYLPS